MVVHHEGVSFVDFHLVFFLVYEVVGYASVERIVDFRILFEEDKRR